MAVVYRHLKPNGEVFYIGIGNKKERAFSKEGRSVYWKRTFKKYGFEVQILKDDLDYKDAQELEKILIAYYGRKDLGRGTLVNLTDGGEGQSNPSEETRKKMRDAKKGIGGESHYFYGKPKSEEHKQKLREAKLGKKLSLEHIENLKKANRSKELKGRKVICTETLRIWNSIADCEKELGCGKRVLENKLNPNNKKNKNNTTIEYLDLYEKGEARERVTIDERKIGKPWTNERREAYFKKIENDLITTGKTDCITTPIINVKTLEIYKTLAEASKAVNISRGRLSEKLNKNNYDKNNTNLVLYKDYLNGTFKVNQKTGVTGLKTLCVETNEQFKSLLEACNFLNLKYKAAYRNIKNKGVYSENNLTLIILN